ncbi:MAG: hypothetical protein QQN41_01380 [Nitrosopumilus sp.]
MYYIYGFVGLLILVNIFCHWIDKQHVKSWGWTYLTIHLGISEKTYRDFTLTLRLHPTVYIGFEASVWSPYISIEFHCDYSKD